MNALVSRVAGAGTLTDVVIMSVQELTADSMVVSTVSVFCF